MIGSSEFLAYAGPVPVQYPVGGFTAARVLEVGAGAGSGTLHLLEELPDARVVCLEPDDGARNALVWRLIDHPSRARVSVLPLPLADTARLGCFDLVVAHHVVCQVPVPQRPALWSSLRQVLSPDGVALFDSHLGRTATGTTPRRKSAEAGNGDYTMTRWFTLEDRDGMLLVRNEYEITDPDGVLVHQEDREDEVEIVDEVFCRRQIEDAGLRVHDYTDGWLRIARA